MSRISELIQQARNTVLEQQRQMGLQDLRQKNLETMGDFSRGLASGLHQTAAGLGGAAHLAGDVTGIKPLRDYGERLARSQEEKASLYPTKRLGEVGGIGDLADWAQGTVGNLLPSMATAFGSSGVGALTSGGGRLLGSKILNSAVSKYAGKQAVNKLGATASKEALQRAADTITKSIGAKAGMFGSTALLETGGNYNELAERGLDETYGAITSIATGTAAAALELMGGQSRIIDTVLGKETGGAYRKTVNRIRAAYEKGNFPSTRDLKWTNRVLREASTQVRDEATQETLQELLSITNVALNDPTFRIWTAENLARMGESGAAGGLMGGGTGAISGGLSARDSLVRQKASALPDDQLGLAAMERVGGILANPEAQDLDDQRLVAQSLLDEMGPRQGADRVEQPVPNKTPAELWQEYRSAKDPASRQMVYGQLQASLQHALNTGGVYEPKQTQQQPQTPQAQVPQQPPASVTQTAQTPVQPVTQPEADIRTRPRQLTGQTITGGLGTDKTVQQALAEARSAGWVTDGEYRLARYIFDLDPTIDENTTLEIVDAVREATGAELAGYGVQFAQGATPAIMGETRTRIEAENAQTAIKLYAGHDADTVVEEFYHRFYDRLSPDEKSVFYEYYRGLQDARPVNEVFAQQGRDYFFSAKLHEKGGALKTIFEKAKSSLLALIGRIRELRGAKIPDKIKELYHRAGTPEQQQATTPLKPASEPSIFPGTVREGKSGEPQRQQPFLTPVPEKQTTPQVIDVTKDMPDSVPLTDEEKEELRNQLPTISALEDREFEQEIRRKKETEQQEEVAPEVDVTNLKQNRALETIRKQEETQTYETEIDEIPGEEYTVKIPGVDHPVPINRNDPVIKKGKFKHYIVKQFNEEPKPITVSEDTEIPFFPNEKEAQKAIDDYTEELIEKYGEDAVFDADIVTLIGTFAKDPIDTPLEVDELNRLRALYIARDQIAEEFDEEKFQETWKQVKKSFPRLPDGVEKAVREFYSSILFHLALRSNEQLPNSTIMDAASDIYRELAKAKYPTSDLVWNMDDAIEESKRPGAWGIDPTPLLEKTRSIMRVLTGQDINTGTWRKEYKKDVKRLPSQPREEANAQVQKQEETQGQVAEPAPTESHDPVLGKLLPRLRTNVLNSYSEETITKLKQQYGDDEFNTRLDNAARDMYLRIRGPIDSKDTKKMLDNLLVAGNTTSRMIFTAITGISMGSDTKSRREAIRKWVGEETFDKYERDRDESRKRKKEERKRQEIEDAKTDALDKTYVRYAMGGSGIVRDVSYREFIDDIIKRGYNRLKKEKRGAFFVGKLYNDKDSSYEFKKKIHMDYIEEKLGQLSQPREEANAQVQKQEETKGQVAETTPTESHEREHLHQMIQKYGITQEDYERYLNDAKEEHNLTARLMKRYQVEVEKYTRERRPRLLKESKRHLKHAMQEYERLQSTPFEKQVEQRIQGEIEQEREESKRLAEESKRLAEQKEREKKYDPILENTHLDGVAQVLLIAARDNIIPGRKIDRIANKDAFMSSTNRAGDLFRRGLDRYLERADDSFDAGYSDIINPNTERGRFASGMEADERVAFKWKLTHEGRSAVEKILVEVDRQKKEGIKKPSIRFDFINIGRIIPPSTSKPTVDSVGGTSPIKRGDMLDGRKPDGVIAGYPVKFERRKYGGVGKGATFTYVSYYKEGEGWISLGDPWQKLRPSNQEIEDAIRTNETGDTTTPAGETVPEQKPVSTVEKARTERERIKAEEESKSKVEQEKADAAEKEQRERPTRLANEMQSISTLKVSPKDYGYEGNIFGTDTPYRSDGKVLLDITYLKGTARQKESKLKRIDKVHKHRWHNKPAEEKTRIIKQIISQKDPVDVQVIGWVHNTETLHDIENYVYLDRGDTYIVIHANLFKFIDDNVEYDTIKTERGPILGSSRRSIIFYKGEHPVAALMPIPPGEGNDFYDKTALAIDLDLARKRAKKGFPKQEQEAETVTSTTQESSREDIINELSDDEIRALEYIDIHPKKDIKENDLRKQFGDDVIQSLRNAGYIQGSPQYNSPMSVTIKARNLLSNIPPNVKRKWKRNTEYFIAYEDIQGKTYKPSGAVGKEFYKKDKLLVQVEYPVIEYNRRVKAGTLYASPQDAVDGNAMGVFKESSGVRFSTRTEPGTQTPEFKAWFGDSKVVDENGNPKVVYHQTSKESIRGIEKEGFNINRIGARGSDWQMPNGVFLKTTGKGISIGAADELDTVQMPLYASIQNPFRAENRKELEYFIGNKSSKYKELVYAIQKKDKDLAREYERTEDDDLFDKGTAELNTMAAEAREIVTTILRENGYDGVFIKNDVGSFGRNTETIVAFNPTQIKSVFNQGTFDPSDSRISYQIRNLPELQQKRSAYRDTIPALRDAFHIYARKMLDIEQKIADAERFREPDMSDLPEPNERDFATEAALEKAYEEYDRLYNAELERREEAIEKEGREEARRLKGEAERTKKAAERIMSHLDPRSIISDVDARKKPIKPFPTIPELEPLAKAAFQTHRAAYEFVKEVDRALFKYKDINIQEYKRIVNENLRPLEELTGEYQSERYDLSYQIRLADLPPGTDPNKVTRPTHTGMGSSVEQVRKWVRAIEKRFGVPIQLMQSVDELPARYRAAAQERAQQGRIIEGLYDTRSGRVYLVADGLRSKGDAERVLLHEVIGHKGLRRTLGQELRDEMDWIASSRRFHDQVLAIAKAQGVSMQEAAEEFFAQQVEKGEVHPVLWRRILAAVKRALRRLGFTRLAEYSDEDLKDLISRAYQTMRQNPGGRQAMQGTRTQPAFSSDEPQDEWYSQMERVLEKKLPGKGTVQQFRDLVKKFQRDFKQEELEWSGLLHANTSPLFGDGDKKVTKDEVLNFIRDNRIVLEEKVLSDDKAKYQGYQIQNNDGKYREFLLKLPVQYQVHYPVRDQAIWQVVYPDGRMTGYDNTYQEAKELIEEYEKSKASANIHDSDTYDEREAYLRGGDDRRIEYDTEIVTDHEEAIRLMDEWNHNYSQIEGLEASVSANVRAEDIYKSGHWDDENVLVHFRINERTDVQGKKILFIEEIQSDWHQEGVKGGYRQKRISDQTGLSEDDLDNVPNAPFKGNAWVLLAFKKIIRLAAEEGYDRIAWTTGKQQADRYNLAKVVSKVEFRQGSTGVHDSGSLRAYNHEGMEVMNIYVGIDELEDYIGKEVAERLINAPVQKGSNRGTPYVKREVSGLDLQIGGEGMLSFYDNTVPNVVKSYVRKWGARPESIEIDTDQGKASVHSIDVTPQMRQAALMGQPLFSMRLHSAGGETGFQIRGKLSPEEGGSGMDILKEIAEDLRSKRIKTKIIKNENGEYIETELYHGSRQTKEKINSFDDNMSRDNAVSVWFTPDKEYASEYGTVHKYKVEIRNPLDLREETTPDIEFGQKDMTVQEWVDLFNSKGVSVDIKDDEWVDVYVKLWDLLYGYDIDATKATNINQSLMNSNYDFIIHKEVGSYKNIVDAFGKIKKSFRLEGSRPSETGFQIRAPQTPEFKAWFGDSKVVDENGNPKVVYHGTPSSGFSAFDIEHLGKNTDNQGYYGEGFYFTDSPKTANAYSLMIEGSGGYPVYLRINNPLYLDEADYEKNGILLNLKGWTATERNAISDFHKDIEPGELVINHIGSKRFSDVLQKNGYDGVIVNYRHRENEYAVFNPNQIKSVFNQGTFDPNNPDIRFSSRTIDKAKGLMSKAKTTLMGDEVDVQDNLLSGGEGVLSWLRRQLQDKLARGETLLKNVSKRTGEDVPEDQNFVMAAKLAIGRESDRIKKLEDEMIDNKDSLIRRLTDKGYTIEQLGKLNLALHHGERRDYIRTINPDFDGEGTGMTDEKAEEILKQYQDTPLMDFAQEIIELSRKALRLRVKAGLLTINEYRNLRKRYKAYVPLKGKPGTEQVSRIGRGFSVTRNEFFKATGRHSEPDNPAIQAILDYQEAIVRAEKNRVGNHFLKLALNNPSNVYSISRIRHTPVYNQHGELLYLDPRYKLADNVLMVKIDSKFMEGMKLNGKKIDRKLHGKPVLITIHDNALAQGMKNLGQANTINILRQINNFFRGVNTIFNPEFVITNLSRDLQTAMVHISGEQSARMAKRVALDWLPAFRGIMANIRGDLSGEWAQEYAELKRNGGRMGWFELKTNQEKVVELEKKIRQYENMKNPKNPWIRLKNIFLLSKELVENINEGVESAVRLAAYRQFKQAGNSEKKAALLSKELTVNFNTKGNIGTLLDSLYLFANASIQGSYRIFKAAKNRKVQKILVGIVALSFLQSLWNRSNDEEEWEQFSDYNKDNYWMLMIPGGKKTLAIKAPYGYNVLHVLGNIMEEWYSGETGFWDGVSRLIGSFNDAFNPLGGGSLAQFLSPTITDPIVQLSENRNFFGGPIRKEHPLSGNKPNSELYFSGVRDVSRWATQRLNELSGGSAEVSGAVDINPEDVDHVIDAMAGGLGKFFANLGDTGWSVLTGDVPKIENVPVLRHLVKGSSDWKARTVVFDMLSESRRTIYNERERSRFLKNLLAAGRSGQIKRDEISHLRKQFLKNQRGASLSLMRKRNQPGSFSAAPPAGLAAFAG